MATKSTDTTKKKTPATLLREKKINAYLEQIGQDEERINLLLQEKSGLLSESFVGLPVTHKQFGSGQVENQDALIISVQFSDSIRRFPLPNAFLDGFLQTQDTVMMQRLAQYRDIEKQITEIKNGISAADHAIQLLKNKMLSSQKTAK